MEEYQRINLKCHTAILTRKPKIYDKRTSQRRRDSKQGYMKGAFIWYIALSQTKSGYEVNWGSMKIKWLDVGCPEYGETLEHIWDIEGGNRSFCINFKMSTTTNKVHIVTNYSYDITRF